MSRLDLSRYFLPIAPKLAGVEAELQRILQSDVQVVQKLADHVRGGQGKRLRPARPPSAHGEVAIRLAALGDYQDASALISR